jgi:hypothetical protein
MMLPQIEAMDHGSCTDEFFGQDSYVLLHHNNRGDMEARPENMRNPRRPAFVALGEFRPGADQPIWFSESKEFADNGGYDVYGEPITDLRKAQDIAVYPCAGRKPRPSGLRGERVESGEYGQSG